MLKNPGSDRLLKEIMRSYSGIFTDYININEALLANRAEMKREDVVRKLAYFNKLKIISYIPIKVKPQLVYAYERLSTKHIHLSDENYEGQKKSAKTRLTSLLNFVNNSLECRSKVLLEYFGEKKVRRCGICDVCLSENSLNLNEIEFSSIEKLLVVNLKSGPKHLYELISSMGDQKEEDVIQVIRWLIDNNKIIRHKDETLSWYNQLDLGFDS